MGAGGFEPPKAEPTGLQPVPFGRSGTPPGERHCSPRARGVPAVSWDFAPGAPSQRGSWRSKSRRRPSSSRHARAGRRRRSSRPPRTIPSPSNRQPEPPSRRAQPAPAGPFRQPAAPPSGCRSSGYSDGLALLAQLVEHLHGKEGVDGSSPSEGFTKLRTTDTLETLVRPARSSRCPAVPSRPAGHVGPEPPDRLRRSGRLDVVLARPHRSLLLPRVVDRRARLTPRFRRLQGASPRRRR